jgi:general nucleoside transport system permease protein
MRARGFGRYTNMVLAAVTGFFIFGFLTWAAAGSSLNLASLLNTTYIQGRPTHAGSPFGGAV